MHKNSIPTVSALFLVLFIATLWNTAASKPRIDPQTLEEEMQAMILKKLESLYQLRIKCQWGEFYSLASEDCKKCEEHCANGTNLELCGEECIVYFMNKGVEETIEKQNEEIDGLEDLILEQQEKNFELKEGMHNTWSISITAIVLSAAALLLIAITALSITLLLWSKSLVRSTTSQFVTSPAHDPNNTQYNGAAPSRRFTVPCVLATSEQSPPSPKNCENTPFFAQPTANNVQPGPNNVQPTPDTQNVQPEEGQGLLNGQATSDSN